MEKFRTMTIIPPLRNPLTGKVYHSNMYKKCVQLEFNKDGSSDLYDYNTCEHLEHYK